MGLSLRLLEISVPSPYAMAESWACNKSRAVAHGLGAFMWLEFDICQHGCTLQSHGVPVDIEVYGKRFLCPVPSDQLRVRALPSTGNFGKKLCVLGRKYDRITRANHHIV